MGAANTESKTEVRKQKQNESTHDSRLTLFYSSPLIPASLITLAHLACSALM
jgi:hypothetical protein